DPLGDLAAEAADGGGELLELLYVGGHVVSRWSLVFLRKTRNHKIRQLGRQIVYECPAIYAEEYHHREPVVRIVIDHRGESGRGHPVVRPDPVAVPAAQEPA